MDIVDFFKLHFNDIEKISDYKIAEFTHNFFIGLDSNRNIVIVLKPSNQSGRPYNINTKALILECNVKVSFVEGTTENVHILKCLLQTKKEKEIFLEVAKLFINDDYSDKYVIETFNTLQSFFSKRNELTDTELIGFYAELYTIYRFHDSLKIEKFWQTKDRLKFDFSFTDKLKLEIKATTKEIRIHHFQHEQLNSNYFNIFVLSYMFRYDDTGLSLFELIEKIKPLLADYKDLYLRLTYIEKNTSTERLKDLKYNQLYTDEKMHFYSAKSIPKFLEETPAGVSKAEYDCNLENIPCIESKEFLEIVTSIT